MNLLATTFISLLACFAVAYGEETLPSPATPPYQQETKAQEETNNAQALPDSVISKPPAQSEITPKQQEPPAENKPQQSNSNVSWWKGAFGPDHWSDWVLVIVAVVAASIGLRTLSAINRQVIANEGSAKAAEESAKAALETAKATVLAQRAYINVSPFPFKPDQIFRVEITNYGETPATITIVAIWWAVAMPQNPEEPAGIPQIVDHYLVKKEAFQHDVPNQVPTAFLKTGNPLYLFGYVDYLTEFRQHWRVVFARAYEHQSKRFVFVRERGRNYDRERKEGEGEDWPKESTEQGYF